MIPTRMWQYEMDEEAHPNQGEAAREAEKIARKRMSYRKQKTRRKACFFGRD